jgi:hypothetical protein
MIFRESFEGGLQFAGSHLAANYLNGILEKAALGPLPQRGWDCRDNAFRQFPCPDGSDQGAPASLSDRLLLRRHPSLKAMLPAR